MSRCRFDIDLETQIWTFFNKLIYLTVLFSMCICVFCLLEIIYAV